MCGAVCLCSSTSAHSSRHTLVHSSGLAVARSSLLVNRALGLSRWDAMRHFRISRCNLLGALTLVLLPHPLTCAPDALRLPQAPTSRVQTYLDSSISHTHVLGPSVLRMCQDTLLGSSRPLPAPGHADLVQTNPYGIRKTTTTFYDVYRARRARDHEAAPSHGRLIADMPPACPSRPLSTPTAGISLPIMLHT